MVQHLCACYDQKFFVGTADFLVVHEGGFEGVHAEGELLRGLEGRFMQEGNVLLRSGGGGQAFEGSLGKDGGDPLGLGDSLGELLV